MLKMGIPLPAVKQALQKEGKDPSIIDMDPEKPFEQQQSKPEEKKQPVKANNGPKVARKRLHWNKIDESKLNEKSFWNFGFWKFGPSSTHYSLRPKAL